MNREVLKNHIKELAYQAGASFCGFAVARKLDEEEPKLTEWLHSGMHGKMDYMENHFDMRLDPRWLVDGARTVISLMFNYFPRKQPARQSLKVSCYAWGEDYHTVIKTRLYYMLERIREATSQHIEARAFVDSAPVMDKAWARLAGLGWVGKHTNLISPKAGSYFFIAEIVCDLDLEPDGPLKDYCGTCTRCLDACPTDALYEPYKIDATQCISYLTIELRDQIPEAFKGQMEGWIYGCDICQQVCPWNRFSMPNLNIFDLNPFIESAEAADWVGLDKPTFNRVFKKSAITRARYDGLKRNIDFVVTPP